MDHQAANLLVERDLKHIWHPCSQMKDYEQFQPVVIKKARGSYIELLNGQKIIDAISSWWCKSLGHNHPRLKQALLKQLNQFEHVILANTTHETIIQLAEKILATTKSLKKIFFASDGSSAVEIALKMSTHARLIKGETPRTHFLALSNSYHGETLGAMSVSDLGLYREPYKNLLFPCQFISEIPYVQTKNDPAWFDCNDIWHRTLQQLEPFAESATAIIIEPIVQAAGNMKIISQDFIRRISVWAKKNNVHLIADEIMTGVGRTGTLFACEHAGIEPDFMCLSKGLTSGWLPFSVMLTSNAIYDLFYDDYRSGKSFLHSHTFSGNALACSIALETLNIMEEENIYHKVAALELQLLQYMHEIEKNTGRITNVRGIGGLVAADLIVKDNQQRAGFELFKNALKNGALLRPIGNTIYWLPPLNVEAETLDQLKDITQQSINETLF